MTPKTYDEWAEKWGVDPWCGSGVGDGWVPLLEALAVKLEKLGFDFTQVAQVKEKFGGLRFYASASARAYNAIAAAERASFKICEDCGAPGKIRKTGWYRTTCAAHATRG